MDRVVIVLQEHAGQAGFGMDRTKGDKILSYG
jgi:hypothetical protein